MAHLNYHPAPGFGDLLPGYFVVPQNPIRDAGTPLVPSLQATAPNKILRIRHIGELMPAVFTVPQNPLITSLSGGRLRGLGCMGCAGMGDVSSTMSADSLGLGLPNWAYLAGAGVLVWVLLMPGGSEYRKKRSALRSQYRGYKRVREAASEALA